MRLGGLQKFSLIDFPGKVAAIVFTQGCLFRCHYCHNPELVLPRCFGEPLREEDFWAFLKSRQGQLDGVVISGGEPTIYKDLPAFIRQIRALDFKVKLDTAGVRPEMVEGLLQDGQIDYIAMDIKAPAERYEEIVGVPVDFAAIEKSIRLILASGVDHEFRTTVVQDQLGLEDIRAMTQLIRGGRRYALQAFHPGKTLNPGFSDKPATEATWLKNIIGQLDPGAVGEYLLRA